MTTTDPPDGTDLPTVTLFYDPDNPDVEDWTEQLVALGIPPDVMMEAGRLMAETARERIAAAAAQVTPAVTPGCCPTCGQALPRTCEWCGGPMVGKRPEARTCSGRCRVALHRAGR